MSKRKSFCEGPSLIQDSKSIRCNFLFLQRYPLLDGCELVVDSCAVPRLVHFSSVLWCFLIDFLRALGHSSNAFALAQVLFCHPKIIVRVSFLGPIDVMRHPKWQSCSDRWEVLTLDTTTAHFQRLRTLSRAHTFFHAVTHFSAGLN